MFPLLIRSMYFQMLTIMGLMIKLLLYEKILTTLLLTELGNYELSYLNSSGV